MHEAALHESSCFLTLTYDEAHLPSDLSLRPRDVALFMKRLRQFVLPARIRFYLCGEYGAKHSRPHYHVLVFGFSPADKVFFRTSGAGFKVFTSASMDSVWTVGATYVGDVSLESAGYVARYVLKKVGSDGDLREILDVDTGEIVTREHEFSRMSLRPGIGANWFDRYFSDVFPHDRVIVKGKRANVPRYYDKLLSRFNPVYLAEIKARRVEARNAADCRMELDAPDSLRFTDLQRLDVHEAVKLASIRSLKRS